MKWRKRCDWRLIQKVEFKFQISQWNKKIYPLIQFTQFYQKMSKMKCFRNPQSFKVIFVLKFQSWDLFKKRVIIFFLFPCVPWLFSNCWLCFFFLQIFVVFSSWCDEKTIHTHRKLVIRQLTAFAAFVLKNEWHTLNEKNFQRKFLKLKKMHISFNFKKIFIAKALNELSKPVFLSKIKFLLVKKLLKIENISQPPWLAQN